MGRGRSLAATPSAATPAAASPFSAPPAAASPSAGRRRAAPAMAAVTAAGLATLLSGCALLTARPIPDARIPATIRAAVEPARAALRADWPGDAPAWFAFQEARCAIGAGTVLVFRQQVGGEPGGHALALTRDLAAGILSGRWQTRFDVPDPAADPAVLALLGDRELTCP